MDTSNISFTALYTGYVWYEHGMSAPFFTSRRGRWMYQAMRPVETFATNVVGMNLKEMLLQRHNIMNHRIEHLIEEEGVTQILEIACGLSPRGYKFSRKHPELHYVEADLPAMAERKKQLLQRQNIHRPNHEVVTCNIFESDTPDGLDHVIRSTLNQNQPVIVITEGLVNYFDLETISPVWQRLQKLLSKFPKAWYLTDLIMDLKENDSYRYVKAGRWALGKLASADVNLHYNDEKTAEADFIKSGFTQVALHKPEQYYGKLPIPRSKKPTLVRIVEAQA